MKLRRAIILAALAALVLSTPIAASVMCVKQGSGPVHNGLSWATAFDKVQDAVIAAVSGDEIWVAGGTYTENVALKSGVALYGGFAGTEDAQAHRDWNVNPTTIDGNKAGSVIEVARDAVSSTRVDGFIITNGRAVLGGGIFCNVYSVPVLANNTITGNTASFDGGGIYCNLGSAPLIAGNRICGNGAVMAGGGVRSISGSTVLTSNIISCNAARRGGGVSFCEATVSHEYLINNTIVSNSAAYGGGVHCATVSSATISNNIVAFNSSGIYKESGAGVPTLANNCLYSNDGYDYSGLSAGSTDIAMDPRVGSTRCGEYHIQPDSPCKDSGSNADVIAGYGDIDRQTRSMGTADIGADESDGMGYLISPSVVLVSPTGSDSHDGTTWATAKRTIQAAIDALTPPARIVGGIGMPGGEVWVAVGTYNERLVLHDYVYVYGGFAGTESVASRRNWRTNVTTVDAQAAGSVVTAALTGYGTSAIDGFTLRNGKDINGAGVLCDHASPLVMNNTITANAASMSGGGICLTNSSSLVKNNLISSNTALQFGGGIYAQHCGARIVSNRIQSNSACYSGSGVHATMDCPCTLANNLITGNRDNASFPGAFGAGVSVASYGPADMICNTISDNTPAAKGSVYCGPFGTLKMRSNIVAYNGTGIFADTALASSAVAGNCVFGNGVYQYTGVSAGSGDIASNPAFLNRAGGDYGIGAVSPCVDIGDLASTPTEDIAGTPRPLDGDANMVSRPDAGCYEYSRGFSTAGDASGADDNALVALTGMVSTAKLNGAFYMENSDRSRGIGVLGACSSAGKSVTVEGVMATVHGERMIAAYNVISGADASIPAPIAVPLSGLGGGPFGRQDPVWNWRGRDWMASGGANNIGLLIKTFGKVIAIDEPNGCFYIDDGSELLNFTKSRTGVKVKYASAMPTVGQDVVVTGIASCESDTTAPDAEHLLPVVLTRQADDVVPI